MLSYFRINDPYRLIIIFILVIILRLPFLISGTGLTLPELSWLTVGDRIAGGALLYADIWTDNAPLSALVFGIIDILFGKSLLSLQIIGLLVFLFQCFYFNYILLRHKAYNESSYVPALIYGILGFLLFDTITLSPQLLGLTFLFPVLDNLFTHMEIREKRDRNLMNIGIYTGIASLFYLPYIFIILIIIAGLALYTTTIRRRYTLMIYSLLFVFLILWMFYFWKGHTVEFFKWYVFSVFKIDHNNFLSLSSVFITIGVSVIIFALAIFKVMMHPGFINFQVRIQSIFLIYAVVMVIIWYLFFPKSGSSLIILTPPVAFFISHYFLLIKKMWRRELMFFIFTASIFLLNYGTTFGIFNLDKLIDTEGLVIRPDQKYAQMEGKKMLVIGDDISPYYFGIQSTPYFQWSLAKYHLEHLEYYDHLAEIDRNFKKDMPEYIIDKIGLAPAIFNKIPWLGQQYLQTTDPEVYKRIEIPHK